jgi:endonuclease III related protein
LNGGHDLSLDDLNRRLDSAYDVENWWPSESPFEVVVGAMLTQQTVWETVSKVLDDMRAKGLLEVQNLANADGTLEGVVRPTGFYNQKARNLRNMARYMMDRYDGDIMVLLTKDLDTARKELMSLKGIGKETADSILLFAAGRPKFVAAAYVSRVLVRTGTFDSIDYDEVQRFVESELPRTARAYKRFYALCVHHCKCVCLSDPRCNNCPLSCECALQLRRIGT